MSRPAPALFQCAEDVIFAALDRMGGSISAEHGIGRPKRHGVWDRIAPVFLNIGDDMTQTLDLQRIVGRGRILSPTVASNDGFGQMAGDPWH